MGFSVGELVQQLRSSSEIPDAELIERYRQDKDPDAFEILVRRYGSMVWSVCLRTLRSNHDAEEAFQSVFLIAIQKLNTVRIPASLPCWLHRITLRVTTQLSINRSRQRSYLKSVPDPLVETNDSRLDLGELEVVIDEEIDRLPDHFRTAFVLCVLKGLSNEQAAKQLGCAKGTIESRLVRARSRLRQRLSDRGIASVWVTSLSVASIPVPEILAHKVSSFASQPPLALIPGLSKSTLALTQGVLHTMMIMKLKWTTAIVMSLCLCFTGIGWVSSNILAFGDDKDADKAKKLTQEKPLTHKDLPKDSQEAIELLLKENARLQKELTEVRKQLEVERAQSAEDLKRTRDSLVKVIKEGDSEFEKLKDAVETLKQILTKEKAPDEKKIQQQIAELKSLLFAIERATKGGKVECKNGEEFKLSMKTEKPIRSVYFNLDEIVAVIPVPEDPKKIVI
jgi:RNA polymerase sigma factor (sigma-70 family)